MSSCSSNGFRSYPRRQCCTTVRFLVELDPNKNRKLSTKRLTKSKSVLQRASAVLINAFKHFPFTGAVNPMKDDFTSTGRSRKLFKHANHHEKNIKQLKSFGELIKEKETTPPYHKIVVKQLKSFGDILKEKETETTPPPSPPVQFPTAAAITATAELNISTSNSNNWFDIGDLTATTTESFTTGDSSEINSSQKDVMDDLEEHNQTANNKIVGSTTATAVNYPATTDNAEKWQNEHIEQLSPVSVMDFPCDNDNDDDDDDNDETSCVFQHGFIDAKEQKKPVQKTRRFSGAHQLEPIKLEDRINHLIAESSGETCIKFVQEGIHVEKKAVKLLHLLTLTTPCHQLFKFEATKSLLLGFFKEKIIEENILDFEMLQTAKDWMDGQIENMFLDWESNKNRQAYVRQIENKAKWSKYGDEVEKESVCLELEHEIFSSLVDDMLLDFHIYVFGLRD